MEINDFDSLMKHLRKFRESVGQLTDEPRFWSWTNGPNGQAVAVIEFSSVP